MADAAISFKRMILGLPHNPRDYPAVSAIALLAKQLGIDLVGTLFEDIALSQLADLPNAREFRAISGWQPLSAAQLTRDLAHMTAEAQRLFAEIIQQQRTRGSFQRTKRSATETLMQAGSNDIIAIIDPKDPIERITRQFRELFEIIFHTAASVLIVPSSPPQAPGPLIAAGSHADDPAIAAAITIATSAKEPLTIIPVEQPTQGLVRAIESAKQSGIRATIAEPFYHGCDLPTLASMSCNLNGKLLITGREFLAVTDRPLVQLRARIPLLLVSSGASSH